MEGSVKAMTLTYISFFMILLLPSGMMSDNKEETAGIESKMVVVEEGRDETKPIGTVQPQDCYIGAIRQYAGLCFRSSVCASACKMIGYQLGGLCRWKFIIFMPMRCCYCRTC